MLHDTRIAARSLRRAPGFTLTAIATLALGIGLSTAVFTVADAMLLRALPVNGQDRIVALWAEKTDGSFPHFPFDLRQARDFARDTRSLESVAFAAYEGAWPAAFREGENITRLSRAFVSGNFFDVLGARPAMGRALRPDDDVVGAAPVVVLSHGAWLRHFGSDSGAIGQQMVLHENGVGHTIVGVMPPGLEYPRGVDVWAALVPGKTPRGTDSTFAHVDVIGRLAPGSTIASVAAEATAFYASTPTFAAQGELRAVVQTLPRLILGDTRPAVIAFAVASLLILLIACINVANLLLVRGLARVQEVAVRSALGASRGRVVRQLLTENALLALAGAVLGVLVANGAVAAFVAFAPAGTPRLDEIALNAGALGGAAVVAAVSMLVFAVAPAVLTSRVEIQHALRAGARQSTGRRSRFITEALVAGQIALALVVLSAAGLIARSLIELESAELALEPSRLLVAELSIRSDQFDDAAKQRALLERVVPAVEAVPGVEAVSAVVAIPFAGSGGWDGRPAKEGQSREEAAANPILNMEVVGPRYFEALGVPILRGRSFTDGDREGAPSVVMLSQAAAKHYWGDEDPIGKRLRMGPSPLTVVGIVPETRYRDLRTARPSVYFPLRQSFFPFTPTMLAIRTTSEPEPLVPAIRRAIAATDPGVALASAAPFETHLARPLAQPRLNALLLAVFAVAAVALAAVGLFGVMATMVRQRTREIGVRMALGATVRDLRTMVLRRGLAIAAIGSAAGLAGALLANRLLDSLLYEVSPTDLTTLGLVTAGLLATAVFATLIPARAMTAIDPAAVLRAEG